MIKVGTFQKSVAGAPVAQSVAGLGFKPKALILWSTITGETLDAWVNYANMTIGMTDGTTSRCACCAMEPTGAAASNAVRMFTSYAITGYNVVTHVVTWQASLSSFDADGFTLLWSTNNATAHHIHYMAIGGDDITNVALVPWVCTVAAGNQSVATVGFQPDLAIHLSNWVADGAIDVGQDNADLAIGAMDSAGNQFSSGIAANDNTAAGINGANTENDNTMCVVQPSSGIIPFDNMVLSYVSMDANGFTINKHVAPSIDVLMASLCFKGGNYRVGAIDEANVPGNQSIAGLASEPEGVFFFSGQCQALHGQTGKAALGIGGMDETSQVATALYYPNTANPITANAFAETDACLYAGTNAAALTDEAVFVSMDALGFTINWTTQGNDDNGYGYIAFDTGPYTPPVPPTPTVSTFHDILFVTRSVGYVSVEDGSGNPEIWRTIDGGYSWHILPDKGGAPPLSITSMGRLAKCQNNHILTCGNTASSGVLVEFTGD